MNRINVWERDKQETDQCNYCLAKSVPVIAVRSTHPQCSLVTNACYTCMAEIASKATLLLGEIAMQDHKW